MEGLRNHVLIHSAMGTRGHLHPLGIDQSSVFALLVLRFAPALGALLLIGLHGTRWQVAALVSRYSVCYFQAMAHGIKPGLLATLLGV